MIIDFTQKEEFLSWASRKLRIDKEYFGNCSTITITHREKILAVAIYSSFNGINCEVSVAADSKWWLRENILEVLFKYPFEQLQCKRITLLIRETNKSVVNLVKKIGFEQEGRLKMFYPDGDNCLVFGRLSERIH